PCMLIINETLAPQTDPAIFPVILDFDLFREQEWVSDDEGIWQFLEQLRERKNTLFEASITDAARKLFD
ncbi:MAG: TIGR04255 family protein, partial [Ktedonobacterales bacterium]